MIRLGEGLTITPGTSVGIDRRDEVTENARQRLARDVQLRLRGRVDFGLEPRAAQRAQAIRVTSEGNRLVIDESDQAAVLGAAAGTLRESDPSAVANMDELFKQGSGVPRMSTGKDGKPRLVFRSIAARDLFEGQRQRETDSSVEQTVTDTLRTGIVDAYEGAFAEVERLHPGDE
jgi:hypothetical protein